MRLVPLLLHDSQSEYRVFLCGLCAFALEICKLFHAFLDVKWLRHLPEFDYTCG